MLGLLWRWRCPGRGADAYGERIQRISLKMLPIGVGAGAGPPGTARRMTQRSPQHQGHLVTGPGHSTPGTAVRGAGRADRGRRRRRARLPSGLPGRRRVSEVRRAQPQPVAPALRGACLPRRLPSAAPPLPRRLLRGACCVAPVFVRCLAWRLSCVAPVLRGACLARRLPCAAPALRGACLARRLPCAAPAFAAPALRGACLPWRLPSAGFRVPARPGAQAPSGGASWPSPNIRTGLPQHTARSQSSPRSSRLSAAICSA